MSKIIHTENTDLYNINGWTATMLIEEKKKQLSVLSRLKFELREETEKFGIFMSINKSATDAALARLRWVDEMLARL